MAITISPEAIPKETHNYTAIHRQTNPRQDNLINSAHKKLIDANDHFFPDQPHQIENHIGGITYKTLAALRKVPSKYIDTPEHGIPDLVIEDAVALAKYEKLDHDQMFEFIEGVLAERLVNFSVFKYNGIHLNNNVNFPALDRAKRLEEVTEEVNKYGLSAVDNFYKIYPNYHNKIKSANTVFDLEAIVKDAENDLSENKNDLIILNKVKSDIKHKIKSLHLLSKENISQTKEEETKEYYDALESNLDYLRYCSPQESLGKMSTLAEGFIRKLAQARDSLEFTKMLAPSAKLAKLFWSIRLKRNIIGLEKLGLTKKMVESYASKISDEILLTEAAGYWFERSTTQLPRYTYTPELALIETIKSTLEAHHLVFSKSGQPVKIMLLINDNTTLKLDIPPGASYQDIVQIIKNGEVVKNQLDMRAKYELKKESYKVGKKNQKYQEFYQQEDNYKIKLFGKKHSLPITHQVDGDYIIRLTTQSNKPTADKNSPFSLFAVNSHKALIDIDLNKQIVEEGAKRPAFGFAVKLAHHHSDGKRARPFYDHIFKYLQEKHDESNTVPQIDFLHEVPEITQHKDEVLSLPIFEAIESMTYPDTYNKFVIGTDKEKVLSPNAIRTAVLELANNTLDAHVLVAAKVNPQASGPFDNVQPVILSLHPIKKIYDGFKTDPLKTFTSEEISQILTWIKKTKEAEDYGKKGLSTAAVLVAPVGSLQIALTDPTEAMHKGVVLMGHSSGMFSPLPNINPEQVIDNSIFVTATSKVYKKRVNLTYSTNSLGVIGYTQSTVKKENDRIDLSTYSIRKTPDQAQPAYSRFINNELLHEPNNAKKLKATTKIFNDILVNWDKLIIGKMNLNDYMNRLEDAYNQLKRSSVCGEINLDSVGITSSFSLQKKLNEILIQDARDTLNAEKLAAEKSSFYGFLNRINEQYGNEDIKKVVDLLV